MDIEVFPEGRTPTDSTFENNVFLFAGNGSWGEHSSGRRVSFHNNFYSGIEAHPSDDAAVVLALEGLDYGDAPKHIDWEDLTPFAHLFPAEGSAMATQGKKVESNGGRDFTGRSISSDANFLGALAPVPRGAP